MEDVEGLKDGCSEMIKDAAADNLQAKIDLAKHIQDISGRAGKSEDTKISEQQDGGNRERDTWIL